MDKSAENLPDSQWISLNNLKENLKDLNLSSAYTDNYLMKFLKAKNFDVKDTEKIFRENYYNRILFGVNTLLETFVKPEVCKKYEAFNAFGFAKDGAVVCYAAVGKTDFNGFIMSMSTHDLLIYMAYLIELNINSLKEENLRTGRDVNEVTIIADFEGFTIQKVLRKCVIEMGLDCARLVQDCYPEIWRHILIINASPIFQSAFDIFKPVLRGNLLDRIQVIKKDSTKETLLKYIDEDVLPAFLGGKRVDSYGDPECREFLRFGGNIPESMYRHNLVPLLESTDPEVECQIIGPRSCFNFSLAIKETAGRWTRLELRTENGSITSNILYREFKEKEDPENPEFPSKFEYLDENSDKCDFKAISVTLRAQAHCCPIDKFTFLPYRGIYTLKMSNQSSWFTSRKVFIRVTVLPEDFTM